MNFVYLNVHSQYSKGWGVATVEELCRSAHGLGLRTLALTDTNGLYGTIEFIRTTEKYNIRPIIGSEIFTREHRAVLLVKDRVGYANLCHIISDRQCDPGFDLVRSIGARRKGLIVFSDDFRLLRALKREIGRDLFVEISPGHGMHEAYAFSRERGIPPLATIRVCLAHPEQYYLHRIIRAVYLRKMISALGKGDICLQEESLKPEREVIDQFPHAPQAVRNTLEVAERCKTNWDFYGTVFPSFRKGFSEEEAFFVLRKKALEGCSWRYGEISSPVRSRLEYELGIIREKGFSQYFLIVSDIVERFSRSCGRGSGAASLVSYALGITHVDPVGRNLVFERFLNPARTEPPDIDLDFAWDERDEILDYVFSRYGNRSVAMVANHNYFRSRSAVHETARASGIPEEEINKTLGKMNRGWGFKAGGPGETWNKIFSTAEGLQGRFRYMATHCGGVVIVPGEIRSYCPVEISSKGVQVLQWEKDSVEESGLVKLDILGNRSLGVIRDTLGLIYKNYGKRIEYKDLDPGQDQKTIRIFYRGNTIGVFYFESPATRQVLSQVSSGMGFDEYLKRDHFGINVIITSIIRPASRGVISTWVSRLHGRPWKPVHPFVKPILEETLGVMVFQEQVSLAATALAGFDIKEADALRKIVSKKGKGEHLRDFYLRFLKGARTRGVNDSAIREVWKMITSFEGYSFCKPHSASYTLVAYKSAFLKACYPAEFMASVISNRGGYYSTLAYISEARRMGLRILLPDINLSERRYTGKDDWIRVGFMQVKGLSVEAVDVVLRERPAGGKFTDVRDFLKRTSIPLHDVLILIKAGCLDSIAGPLTRPALIWESYRYFYQDRDNTGSGLFPGPKVSVPKSFSSRDRDSLGREKEIFGLIVSTHPLNFFGKALERVRCIAARDLFRYAGLRVTTVGLLVTGKRIAAKNGKQMGFLSFEDMTGIYETVFFPEAYTRFSHMLEIDRAYILKGKVERDSGTVSLAVDWISAMKNR